MIDAAGRLSSVPPVVSEVGGKCTALDGDGVATPNPGVTITHPSNDSDLARAVSALLPGHPAVQLVTRTKSSDGGGNLTKLSTVINGVGYEVTVYKVSSEEELADGGSPKLDVPEGALAWSSGVAGPPEPRTGVFYLNQKPRVGLKISNLTTGDAPLDSVETLLAIAKTAAEDPVVLKAAQPDN